MEYKESSYGHSWLNAMNRLKDKEPLKHRGKSLTQPDMALSVQEIMRRSAAGMPLAAIQPVYLGDNFKEFINFENLSTIEKLEFSRKYKATAENAYQTLKNQTEQKLREQAKAESEALNNINQPQSAIINP